MWTKSQRHRLEQKNIENSPRHQFNRKKSSFKVSSIQTRINQKDKESWPYIPRLPTHISQTRNITNSTQKQIGKLIIASSWKTLLMLHNQIYSAYKQEEKGWCHIPGTKLPFWQQGTSMHIYWSENIVIQ